jgi:hypothetical protein
MACGNRSMRRHLGFSYGTALPGPTPSKMAGWTHGNYERPLLDAKIFAVEANKHALTRTEVVFVIQAGTTTAGMVFLVLAILGGNP